MLGGHFVGTCSSIDFATERQQHERTIAEYHPQEWPCPYDLFTGSTNCLVECISYKSPSAECPERILYHAERKLSRNRELPVLMLAFAEPSLAKCNDLLEDRGLINSHQ